MLRVGGLSSLGLNLPGLLASQAVAASENTDPTFGRAKSVIYVWLQGGPPQHETFDPKPDAPSGIRGVFSPIQTNVPGVQFCELLPRTARIADKLAVVRSMATDNNQHSGSGYEVLTGYKYQGANPRKITPGDWPWFGSLVKQLKPSEKLPPLSTVWIPQIMRLNENVTPAGQTGGFLGRRWDPDRFQVNPMDPGDGVPGLQLGDVPTLRLKNRVGLLEQVDRHFGGVVRGREPKLFGTYQDQAFDILINGRVRNAFDVSGEPETLRRRYGMSNWNQLLLLSRRLVEAGVRLVHVNWVREPGDSAVDNPMWDTHAQNADRLEDVLCPKFDVGFTALIEDLETRGLLDETLVVAIAEFGRTPKINPLGGRDHWGPVFSFAMAGAGIAPGQVYGASDRQGAYPARNRVTPADLTATIFHLLGIDPFGAFHDPLGRELQLTKGEPIRDLLGTRAATDVRVVPGGSLDRVKPFDGRKLNQRGFGSDTVIEASDFGSRPKGWRAKPLLAVDSSSGFGAWHVPSSETVRLGFAAARTPATGTVFLGQEMINPRAGGYLAKIRLRGHGPIAKLATAKLEFCRYSSLVKDPSQRQTLVAHELPVEAFQDGKFVTLEFSARLDSSRPGSNFAIGRGLGVVVTLSPRDVAKKAADDAAWLEIADIEVIFTGRTINENVTV
jgi:hypothetical protein